MGRHQRRDPGLGRTSTPGRMTISGLAGGVINIRRTREGAVLEAIQGGSAVAVVALDVHGLNDLSEYLDDAAEAIVPTEST